MTISFGGLSTGLDTDSIIDQLMNIERLPIVRYEQDKTWLNNKLTAFTQLDGLLKTFNAAIADLDDSESLLKRSVSTSSEDYFTASVSSDATPGAGYSVEVVSLANVQKSVSDNNFASKDDDTFGTGTLTLTVDGEDFDITIDSENNSLSGIVEAINDSESGVNASIINDGDETEPYKLVLTGENVAVDFSLSSSLVGGTTNIGSLTTTQAATRAHIKVDSTDIYADSNTLTEAIPGVTLNLLQEQETAGDTTSINVSLNTASIKSTIKTFATGYNGVISFISGQSAMGETNAGVLAGDSGINTIKRHLQDMLTQQFENSGIFSSLSELGFETQKDGTLTVDDTTLSNAVSNNIDSVLSLLAGDDGEGGLATQFTDYLSSMTNSSTGMLKGRKDSTTTNIERINTRIEMMEVRLEKREEMLRAQFTAMELLVSNLNAQSDYLTQQMDSISSLTNRS